MSLVPRSASSLPLLPKTLPPWAQGPVASSKATGLLPAATPATHGADAWVDSGACAPIPSRKIKDLAKTQTLTFVSPERLPGTRAEAKDGDTVTIPRPPLGTIAVRTGEASCLRPIAFDEEPVSVRMKHLDTPELHVPDSAGNLHSQGEPAEFALAQLAEILGSAKEINIQPDPKRPIDFYGRLLGTVSASIDGKTTVDVNAEMLRRGAGDLYEIYGPSFNRGDFDRMRAAAKEAVVTRKGIYGDAHFCPERPYLFRAKVQERDLVRFCADMDKGIIVGTKDAEKIPLYDRLWIDPEDVNEASRRLGLKSHVQDASDAR